MQLFFTYCVLRQCMLRYNCNTAFSFFCRFISAFIYSNLISSYTLHCELSAYISIFTVQCLHQDTFVFSLFLVQVSCRFRLFELYILKFEFTWPGLSLVVAIVLDERFHGRLFLLILCTLLRYKARDGRICQHVPLLWIHVHYDLLVFPSHGYESRFIGLKIE